MPDDNAADNLAVADEDDELVAQESDLPTSFPDDTDAVNAEDPTYVPMAEVYEGAEVTE